MKYGFTGTRSLRPEHVPTILAALRLLPDGTHFFTGAARGADTYVARALIQLYPDAKHTLVVPAGPYNTELVEGWLPNGTTRFVHDMPGGSSYRDRNDRIVALSDRVVGFPLYDESRQPRSGTWQTVRMAKRHGKLHRCVVLEPEPDTPGSSAPPPAGVAGTGRSRRPPLS